MNSQLRHNRDQCRLVKGLGKHVCQLVAIGNREKMNELGVDFLANHMEIKLNVFSPFMGSGTVFQIDG